MISQQLKRPPDRVQLSTTDVCRDVPPSQLLLTPEAVCLIVRHRWPTARVSPPRAGRGGSGQLQIINSSINLEPARMCPKTKACVGWLNSFGVRLPFSIRLDDDACHWSSVVILGSIFFP